MGAEFNLRVMHEDIKTEQEALAEGERIIEKARYDYGHAGYSGSFAECWGVMVAPFVADNEHDADEWLQDNADKWGPMMLVRCRNGVWVAGAWCSS